MKGIKLIVIFCMLACLIFAQVSCDTSSPVEPEVFNITKYGMDERHEITYYLYDTGKEGMNVAIIGGVHGNETAGWGAALHLVENFNFRKGKILILPKANKLACDLLDRYPGATSPGPYLADTLTYKNNPDYTDMNRVFPGKSDGTMTQRIASVITEILDEFQPELIFDCHEARTLYTEDSGSLGNSIITPVEYTFGAEHAIDALNETDLTPEKSFRLFNAVTAGMISTTYSKRYDAPTFTLETTRHEGLANPDANVPLERRIQIQVFIINSIMDYYGAK